MPSASASDTTQLHQALVDQLASAGHIRNPRVEAAFRAVPRHPFLPDIAPDEVYRDTAIVTKRADGQPISSSSQPAIMAIMLEQSTRSATRPTSFGDRHGHRLQRRLAISHRRR